MIRIHRRAGLCLSAVAACSVVLSMSTGCGGSSKAYTPSSATAREALDAALASWQKGSRPDQLAVNATPVHPVDFQWLAGAALEGYTIVAEETGGEAGDPSKTFSVDLKLKAPAKATKARYVVLGRSPIWVYREEDYARLLNMDNNPRPARTGTPNARDARGRR
jgi:hypothetical protein